MFRKDPRTQLYSVARQSLERLGAGLLLSDIYDDQLHEWDNFFGMRSEARIPFDFFDAESSFQCDSAKFFSLYEANPSTFILTLLLHKNGSPYCREGDVVTEVPGINGWHDIVLGPEMPPTIVPSESHDGIDQQISNIYRMVKCGVAEPLQLSRAVTLTQVLQGLEIADLDIGSIN